jgi:hypothetical protein
MKLIRRLVTSANWWILLVTVFVFVTLLSALSSCTNSTRDGAITSTCNQIDSIQPELKFDEFYSINFGPGKCVLINASRELIWRKGDSTLKLVVSPLSAGGDRLHGFECKTIEGRDFYFRDLVIHAHGTTRIEGTNIISGPDITTPLGREIVWIKDPYRYSLLSAPTPYTTDQAAQAASTDTAILIEKNIYYSLQSYNLNKEGWSVRFDYDGIPVDIIFHPQPFAEPELKEFIRAHDAKPVGNGKVFYSATMTLQRPEHLAGPWLGKRNRVCFNYTARSITIRTLMRQMPGARFLITVWLNIFHRRSIHKSFLQPDDNCRETQTGYKACCFRNEIAMERYSAMAFRWWSDLNQIRTLIALLDISLFVQSCKEHDCVDIHEGPGSAISCHCRLAAIIFSSSSCCSKIDTLNKTWSRKNCPPFGPLKIRALRSE